MSSAKQSVKRALALSTGAVLSVGALAFVAPAANAAVGDQLQLVSAGPARNAGAAGAVVRIKGNQAYGAAAVGNPATLFNIATTGNATASNAAGAPLVVSSSATATLNSVTRVADSDPTDAFNFEFEALISLTTTTDGQSATFDLFRNDAGAGIQAGEPVVPVTLTTGGQPKSAQITPSSQYSTPGDASAPYTVEIRDAGGRLTQLDGAESVTLSANPGPVTFAPASLNVAALRTGKGTFTAAAASGAHTLTAGSAIPGFVAGTATLNTVLEAQIDADELDIVTGADTWNGFSATNTFGGFPNARVRADQQSITLNFQSTDLNSDGVPDDANRTVVLTAREATPAFGPSAAGAVLTFDGGKTSKQYTTVLDAQGKGSITITPDAGTVKDGSRMQVTGNFTGGGAVLDVQFERSAVSVVTTDAQTYISKVGGSVAVEVTGTDQFGQPAAGAQVDVQRLNGVNADATPRPRQTLDASGKTTFTLADTKATASNRAADTLAFRAFLDSLAPAPLVGVTLPAPARTVLYTVDGLGNDVSMQIDGAAVDAPGYNPASFTATPLSDGVADNIVANIGGVADERFAVTPVGGTPGAKFTVSADNGALVMINDGTPKWNELPQAAASKSGIIGAAGQIYVVGTKEGLVNVTFTSGGKSKTAGVTVANIPNNGNNVARNISVTGPATAKAGSLVTFIAKVTDEFGNPAVGFGNPINGRIINVQVSGPAAVQDTAQITNAAGEYRINVRLANNADSPVKVSVTGFGGQLGAAANLLQAGVASAANYGPGLKASVSAAEATIGTVTPALTVEEAQAAVDAAKASLAAANADLNTTQAQKRSAQQQLNKAVRTLKQAQKGLKKAKKAKKGIAKAKQKVNRAKRAVNTERRKNAAAAAAVKAANVKVNNAKANVAKAEADLAEAQS